MPPLLDDTRPTNPSMIPTLKKQAHCFSLFPLQSLHVKCDFKPSPIHFHSNNFPTSSLSLSLLLLVTLKVGSPTLLSKMRSLDDNVPTLKLLDFSLRMFVIPLSVASIWLTVTNQQDNSNYGKLEFSNLLGLKYMVCISAISAGYALVAAVSLWVKSLVTKAWIFFVSDQVVAYLMVTSGAAVEEILYLAYNGDREITWSEACSSYGRFCTRMKIALVLHALALCCFLVLAVISACRVFSMFEPPLPFKQVEEQ